MHVKVRNNTLTLNTENNTNYTIIINEIGEVDSIIHNIMLPILSNTITINSSDYDEFIKTNTSANGGVIHRDESDIRFMKDDVDKIYIVSDKYNKNWLKITSQIPSLLLYRVTLLVNASASKTTILATLKNLSRC